MAWTSAEACSHAMNSYITRFPGQALLAIGINVERAAIPSHALGLDLKAFGISVAMAMYGNRSSDRNNAFLQSCCLGAGRRRQRQIPDLALGAYFHRGVWSCQAYTAFDRPRDLKFLIQVSTPSVMGQGRTCRNRKRENCDAYTKREW